MNGRHCIGSGFWIFLGVLGGCDDVVDLDPIDDTPPIEARVRPKPIIGGTLAIMADGTAVAADPDRGLVHIVDLQAARLVHTVALAPDDEPGRVVEGAANEVYVVLRGFGGVATIDRQAGTLLAKRTVCRDPRGAAYDAETSVLHVACADGTLVQLDSSSGEEVTRVRLDPDLRDVALVDGVVHASRFRAASLVRQDGTTTAVESRRGFEPHVAWRTSVTQDGRILMLHQFESTDPVVTNLGEEDVSVSGEFSYGGGGFCEPGLTNTGLSIIEGSKVTTHMLSNAALTVDAALSPAGDRVALAMPGVEEGRSSVTVVPLEDSPCFIEGQDVPDLQVTSVAYDAKGGLAMLSREPARIVYQHHSGESIEIELPGESRFDSGHELFHRSTPSGMSCASCHPEGADDGHVWRFASFGLRRTQSLDIGLEDTAPFHWDGEMTDLEMIMGEVLSHRMGGHRQSEPRRATFARWMFAQQRPPAATMAEDPSVIATGQALFVSHGCATCHSGPALGGVSTHPIRGIPLQVPSLRRVSLHPPYMHDGRSSTLDDAVRDMIETTTTREPVAAEIHAISAYLRTL